MDKITEYCTGCRACEQKCAYSAIIMQPNTEGFLTAYIDNAKCVDCGLCQKMCPQNKLLEKHIYKAVLAVRNKNDKEIKASASGGAFTAIARNVLNNYGIVVGAAYNDDMSVSHVLISNLDELHRLQSSKYVQSNTEHTYTLVKKFLNEDKTVLYSGTPCQIGGLKAYLCKDYENLYTIDLICHGVASPKLFAKYIKWQEDRMGGNISFYDFRCKNCGWGLDYEIKTKTKTKTISCNLDPYYYHFLKGTTYRECCYKCNYCINERIGDITIGDYWGIEKEHSKFYSSKGVSCVLINTDKGEKIFEKSKNEFYSLESTFEQVAKGNHNLKQPTSRPSMRDLVYKHIDDMEINNYFTTQLPIPFNIKAYLKILLPKWIMIFIKKLSW